MNSDIIFKHWLNPATPEKKIRKLADKAMTPGGRVLQGEKGIGRFAILKLGRKVTIITPGPAGGGSPRERSDCGGQQDYRLRPIAA